MKTLEYKKIWLEKQLSLFEEREKELLENLDVIISAIVMRYCRAYPQMLEKNEMIQIMRNHAFERIDSYRVRRGDIKNIFDVSRYDAGELLPCVVWCVELLKTYEQQGRD
ncbi:MAG: hypothetical protein E7585_05585 [Ruminococcaceae bacterium]|nr:hypothetical protein [Oscillospiraceae bacterium]